MNSTVSFLLQKKPLSPELLRREMYFERKNTRHQISNSQFSFVSYFFAIFIHSIFLANFQRNIWALSSAAWRFYFYQIEKFIISSSFVLLFFLFFFIFPPKDFQPWAFPPKPLLRERLKRSKRRSGGKWGSRYRSILFLW